MKAKMLVISLAAGSLLAAKGAEDATLMSDEMYSLEGGGVLHVFRQDGTLKVKSPGNISFVLVGGGGAGGDHRGGGGGAGGVITNAAYYVDAGNYAISVGIGEKAAFTEYVNNETGETKTNRLWGTGISVTTNEIAAIAATSTTFGDLFTAYPGGRGGNVRSRGYDGASGGGGGGFGKEPYSGGKAIYADAGNLGHAGGSSLWMEGTASGAGGGGAGSPGEDRTNAVGNVNLLIGGHGGTGVVTRITGRDFWVGGGGNAQGVSDWVAPGGGGIGTSSTSSTLVKKGGNGAAYTGGGGGGSGDFGNNEGLGGDGGSGVALFRTEGALPEIAFAKDIRATGGTINEKSVKGTRWCIHTFTESGTFTLPQGTVVEMLLVGGGGGGGTAGFNDCAGGGGGGGSVVVSTNYIAAGSYEVVVGLGGEAANNGENSTFFGYCALGGGGGGNVRGGGKTGGCSGGGGAWGNEDFPPGVVKAQTNDWSSMLGFPIAVVMESQYGNSGGYGRCNGGGGGGGAGTVGASVEKRNNPGKGGDGIESDITGAVVCYGGGGGGGGFGNATFWENGGKGGGGKGGGTASSTNADAKSYGLPGTDGLGGGGGGGGGGANNFISNAGGGKGGSGVVILRYRIKPMGFLLSVR